MADTTPPDAAFLEDLEIRRPVRTPQRIPRARPHWPPRERGRPARRTHIVLVRCFAAQIDEQRDSPVQLPLDQPLNRGGLLTLVVRQPAEHEGEDLGVRRHVPDMADHVRVS
ncbi:hypothetical protein ACWDQ0_32945 [Streptomyces sp. NPDC003642]